MSGIKPIEINSGDEVAHPELARAEDLPTLSLSELIRPRAGELTPIVAVGIFTLIGILAVYARLRIQRP